jgi:beta-xylosidase
MTVLTVAMSCLSSVWATNCTNFAITTSGNIEKRNPSLTPALNGMNFPDPSIILVDNSWWAFATMGSINGKRVHVQMAHSNDFTNWTSFGQQDALPSLPAWISVNSPAVWAPDVVQLGPGKLVMYYTAALKSNSAIHCLGVATASTVSGPYTPVGREPWVCPAAQGGAIDPSGYRDPADNTRWVVYKVDGNAMGHGGNCNNGIHPIVSTPILLQQVSAQDGFTKIGSPTTLITNDPADGPVVEAPSLNKMADGTFVLYFSSNCWATPLYDVSFATSKNIRGPYRKYGPLMVTGMYNLVAPGGLDVGVNGNHAVFHANWNGGRAMFTALLQGTAPRLQALVKTS